jgi:mono/diheme cytochrome c family protein
MGLKPSELSGIHYYRQESCGTCHNVTGGEAKAGPNLLNTAKRHDQDWLLKHFKEPQAATPGSAMTPVNLTAPQISDLAATMKALTPENGDVITTTPDFAADGAALYQKNSCDTCHTINGEGGQIGPVLNGISQRRTEAWTIEHFVNPQKMSPGTPMDAYKFTPAEMQNIVSYLFTLPNK